MLLIANAMLYVKGTLFLGVNKVTYYSTFLYSHSLNDFIEIL